MDPSIFRDSFYETTSNWVVITGAPCSGKTAIIHQLAQGGHTVIHEVARKFIDDALKNGLTLADIKADVLTFERDILEKKIEIETHMPKDQLVFFDRGIPDSIAYYLHANLHPLEPVQKSYRIQYKKVFLCERLPFVNDPIRKEPPHIAEQLHHLLEEIYDHLGYEIIHVPVLSEKERTQFILSSL